MQSPRRKLDVFASVLACEKSAHMFQKLSYLLYGLCLSLSSLTTVPQTVRLFYISLHSQAPQQQYTVLSFIDVKAWPQSQTDLFRCSTVLHCGHTFLTVTQSHSHTVILSHCQTVTLSHCHVTYYDTVTQSYCHILALPTSCICITCTLYYITIT